MQPDPPPNVSSTTPPHFGQVRSCCEGSCIYFGEPATLFRPDRGNDCSILASIPCLISGDISSDLKPKAFDNPAGRMMSRIKLATPKRARAQQNRPCAWRSLRKLADGSTAPMTKAIAV